MSAKTKFKEVIFFNNIVFLIIITLFIIGAISSFFRYRDKLVNAVSPDEMEISVKVLPKANYKFSSNGVNTISGNTEFTISIDQYKHSIDEKTVEFLSDAKSVNTEIYVMTAKRKSPGVLNFLFADTVCINRMSFLNEKNFTDVEKDKFKKESAAILTNKILNELGKANDQVLPKNITIK